MSSIRSENTPLQLSPRIGDTVEMLRSLDAGGLHSYASQSSLTPEPVKTLAEIALETGRPLSNRTGEAVLRDVGSQLDPAAEHETSLEMALFLRRSTGEGVYPHIISTKDSWELTADIFVVSGSELVPRTAQFLLPCAGVQRLPLMEVLGINAHKFGNYAASFAQALYRRPEQQRQLGDRAAAMLLPLVLPEVPEASQRMKQLRYLADKLFDEDTALSFVEASHDRQQEVIDSMGLRYLDRPRSIMPHHNPWEQVNRIRYYAQGHRVSDLAPASNLGLPAFSKSLCHMEEHFKESLSPGDIEEIQHFLAGNSDRVVLQRSQSLDAAFAEANVQKRAAYDLHRRNTRRAASGSTPRT